MQTKTQWCQQHKKETHYAWILSYKASKSEKRTRYIGRNQEMNDSTWKEYNNGNIYRCQLPWPTTNILEVGACKSSSWLA